jgi:hypothetical protein
VSHQDDDAPGSDAAWVGWRARLGDALLMLGEGGVLVLTASGLEPRRTVVRRARLRGLVPGRTEPMHAYLRLVRQEAMLRGECVAATEDGGRYPLTEEERARAADLGWHAPTTVGEVHYVRWWPDDVPTDPYLPGPLLADAVTCVERTARLVFGCRTPDDVSGLPST